MITEDGGREAERDKERQRETERDRERGRVWLSLWHAVAFCGILWHSVAFCGMQHEPQESKGFWGSFWRDTPRYSKPRRIWSIALRLKSAMNYHIHPPTSIYTYFICILHQSDMHFKQYWSIYINFAYIYIHLHPFALFWLLRFTCWNSRDSETSRKLVKTQEITGVTWSQHMTSMGIDTVWYNAYTRETHAIYLS